MLDAATKSLTTDPGLSSVKKIADLAGQFQDIGLGEVKFITVPFASYEPDPNRLVWTEDAKERWKKVRFDQPLSKRLSADVITAAEKPGEKASPSDPRELPLLGEARRPPRPTPRRPRPTACVPEAPVTDEQRPDAPGSPETEETEGRPSPTGYADAGSPRSSGTCSPRPPATTGPSPAGAGR